MRLTRLLALSAVLSIAVSGPAYAAGDPAPDLHGSPVGAASPVAPAPTPSVPVAPPVATPTPTATPAPAAAGAPPVGDDANAAARRSLEYGYAKGESRASDLHGVMESLYQGKWFSSRFEDTRQCIVRHETGGNYESVSSGGDYRGGYQMSRALAVGATWMMQREVRKDFGEEFVPIVEGLRTLPTHKWNRYWQDRAFWTIWRDGDGRSHWPIGGC